MNKREQNNEVRGRFLSVEELREYTSLGRATADKVAKAAGATIKVGRRVVYDREKIDAYMETLAAK